MTDKCEHCGAENRARHNKDCPALAAQAASHNERLYAILKWGYRARDREKKVLQK